VFGGVERESGRTFLVHVPDRSVDILVNLIRAWIEPGTTIISDCWAAYRDVGSIGYTHRNVNHAVSFVSPDMGDHTNTIKSMWRVLSNLFNPTIGGRITSTIWPITCTLPGAGHRECFSSTSSSPSSRPLIGPVLTHLQPYPQQPHDWPRLIPPFRVPATLIGMRAFTSSPPLTHTTYPCSVTFIHDLLILPSAISWVAAAIFMGPRLSTPSEINYIQSATSSLDDTKWHWQINTFPSNTHCCLPWLTLKCVTLLHTQHPQWDATFVVKHPKTITIYQSRKKLRQRHFSSGYQFCMSRSVSLEAFYM
jgi:hypothetical protein